MPAEMSYSPLTVEELLETFDDLEAWDERYGYLIELGREIPAMPEQLKTQDTKVDGCMSQVWMTAALEADHREKVVVTADSDSMIVKGLIAVLLAIYSGKTPQEILAAEPNEVFDRLGLQQHLSSQRRNGLSSMVGRVKQLAAGYAGLSS